MQSDNNTSAAADRFGAIDVTVLDGAHEKDRDITRIDLRKAPDEPAEFDLIPTQHSRFEIAVGDHVVSIGYTPPKISPYAPPPPKPIAPAYLRSGKS